jgi:class III cytochrome C family protein
VSVEPKGDKKGGAIMIKCKRHFILAALIVMAPVFLLRAGAGDEPALNTADRLVKWSFQNAGPGAPGADAQGAAAPDDAEKALAGDVRRMLHAEPEKGRAIEEILKDENLNNAQKQEKIRKLLGEVKACPKCGRSHPFDYLFCPYDGTFLKIRVAGASSNEGCGKDAEAKAPLPESILISNKGYKSDKKGGVTLTHALHVSKYGVPCAGCHHDYRDGKNVWKQGDPVKPCAECHDPLKKQGDVMKLQNSYHKNCKGCHKDLSKEGKKTGPYKKCSECHRKKQ